MSGAAVLPRGSIRLLIDTHDLKARVDLLDLIGRDTDLKKVASTGGGEYAGACPSCGGEDRFRVWPYSDRPGYWCRGCDHKGDAIGYVEWHQGVSFMEAVEILGGGSTLRLPTQIIQKIIPSSRPSAEPSAAWQARATEVALEASRTLRSARGERAMQYLRRRGLADETLEIFVVGYIPSDRYEPAEDWGLTGEAVRIPRGITIPWLIDSKPWAIKVRRPSGLTPKYQAVRGSVMVLFGTDLIRGRETLVLPEGEFDAMLLVQEMRGEVDVATLGGAGKHPDARARLKMMKATRILVALDGDEAGERGAEKLLGASARMRKLALPAGQDITDFYLDGGDLRRLVAAEAGGVPHEPSASPVSVTSPTAPEADGPHERAIPDPTDGPLSIPESPILPSRHVAPSGHLAYWSRPRWNDRSRAVAGG